MASVTFRHVKKTYPGDVTAVPDLNLEIQDREFLVLVGPSGCGKSTTLRMIAGLEEVSDGQLYIGDQMVNDVAPRDRDISLVLQNSALYPHMTVYRNIAFGLALQKLPKREVDRRVREVARSLDLEPLLSRMPKALSGGQRQRVALGRAMIRDPSVFLLDEPLSNLDANLRTSMREEIRRLHQRLQTTFVYVTHDQTAAMSMGDRIAVMKDGAIQQIDTPQMLYDHPRNLFVAGFIGSPRMNFSDAVLNEEDGAYGLSLPWGSFPLPDGIPRERLSHYVGRPVVLGIRSEDISPVPDSAPHHIDARIETVESAGAELYLHVSSQDIPLVVRAESTYAGRAGDPVALALNLEKIHLFDKETEAAITHIGH